MDETTYKYVTTFSGKKIYIENPNPDQVLLKDITHQLGMTCRFGGAVREFYSVAQHSSLCYYLAVDAGLNLPTQVACLIHDANEGPYPDIQRPIKEYMNGKWAVVEQPLEDVIYQKYMGKHLQDVDWKALKKIDNILCVLEGRALLNRADWTWDEKWKHNFEGMPISFNSSIYDILDYPFRPFLPKIATEAMEMDLSLLSIRMLDYDPEWNSIRKEMNNE